MLEAIRRCVNSRTRSYRYVLPTQLLAKHIAPEVDARCIQRRSDLPGSFDARSFCHRVIVPFDRDNHAVLGGSPEPYVNNPLRIPSFVRSQRGAQRDTRGFDDLVRVLEYAQDNPSQVEALLLAVLGEIRARLERTRIAYPVPNRLSLKQTKEVISAFLERRSGGLRLQCVALGLFRALGEILSLYSEVTGQRVNAADRRTGTVGDLSCRSADGKVVLAVEVKDTKLTIRHVQDKLPQARERAIRELIFLVQGGVASSDADRIGELIEREFVTGQNIYVCEFDTFLHASLVLLGESGRRQVCFHVGAALEQMGADLRHRQDWRDLLERL